MLKPAFERLQTSVNSSFTLRAFKEFSFSAPYHYHPEYELTLIVKGAGKRFAGSNMAEYDAGDLVLLGSNLPHCWKIDNPKPDELNGHSIVIQFQEDFLGTDFFTRPEFAAIAQLLKLSANGMQFINNTQRHIADKMNELIKQTDNFKRVITVLEILKELAGSTEFKLLNTEKAIAYRSTTDQQRINEVSAYIVENFRQKITLEKAAGIANMTTNAFCKYFKKITRKTFMEIVIDYRLSYATQQLVHTSIPVNQIAFDCGFNDTAQFYKTFRQKIKMSPLAYRKKFVG